jgi:hypothetical protein
VGAAAQGRGASEGNQRLLVDGDPGTRHQEVASGLAQSLVGHADHRHPRGHRVRRGQGFDLDRAAVDAAGAGR